MEVVIDPDVGAVAEFMQRKIPAAKLVGVANRLSEIAFLLWGQFEQEDVAAMQLIKRFEFTDPRELNSPPHNVTEPPYANARALHFERAGDGSVAGTADP